MLVLPLKPAVRFDIHTALARWLDDSNSQVSFQPTNPLQFVLPKPDFNSVQCREELVRLQSLRNCISDSILKANSHKAALEENALTDCQEYHAALLEFEKRGFPTIEDELSTGLHLTWKGAFGLEQKEKHATLIWDRAVTLFNTAALLTFSASECAVTDREANKIAVSHCQTAGGLLYILRELVSSQDFATVDLSTPMLLFWEKYLTAEAQYRIYRMAAANPETNSNPSSKHTTLAVLAQSCHELFNDALTASQDPRLQSDVPKQADDWATYCKAVSMLNAARAEYHDSVVQRVTTKWGKEVARLRECLVKLKACREFCKSLPSDSFALYTKRECLAIYPVVDDRLHEADKDNYKIYQEEIPQQTPPIPAKQLAKIKTTLPDEMLLPKKALFTNL